MLHIWPVAVPQLYPQCKLSQVRKYKVWQDQHECITTTHLATHTRNPSIEMSTTWQTHVLALLNTNHASIFNLLLFTLQTPVSELLHHYQA